MNYWSTDGWPNWYLVNKVALSHAVINKKKLIPCKSRRQRASDQEQSRRRSKAKPPPQPIKPKNYELLLWNKGLQYLNKGVGVPKVLVIPKYFDFRPKKHILKQKSWFLCNFWQSFSLDHVWPVAIPFIDTVGKKSLSRVPSHNCTNYLEALVSLNCMRPKLS